MSTALKKLRIRQLEGRLAPVRELGATPRPPGGWLRAIRESLGMSARQVAERQGVSRQAIAEQESREAEGSITLSALRRAAEAMGCDLFYVVVPQLPMPELLRQRARAVVAKNLGRVAHSMGLEDQAVSDEEFEQQVEDMAEELLSDLPRSFWDD